MKYILSYSLYNNLKEHHNLIKCEPSDLVDTLGWCGPDNVIVVQNADAGIYKDSDDSYTIRTEISGRINGFSDINCKRVYMNNIVTKHTKMRCIPLGFCHCVPDYIDDTTKKNILKTGLVYMNFSTQSGAQGYRDSVWRRFSNEPWVWA